VRDRSGVLVGNFAGYSASSMLVVEDWGGTKVVAMRDPSSGSVLASRNTNLVYASTDCTGPVFTDMGAMYMPMQGPSGKKYVAAGPAVTMTQNSWFSWQSPPYGCNTGAWTGLHWQLVEVTEPAQPSGALYLQPN